MESQPQNPEFGNNPENFHPCKSADTEAHQKKHCSPEPTMSHI